MPKSDVTTRLKDMLFNLTIVATASVACPTLTRLRLGGCASSWKCRTSVQRMRRDCNGTAWPSVLLTRPMNLFSPI